MVKAPFNCQYYVKPTKFLINLFYKIITTRHRVQCTLSFHFLLQSPSVSHTSRIIHFKATQLIMVKSKKSQFKKLPFAIRNELRMVCALKAYYHELNEIDCKMFYVNDCCVMDTVYTSNTRVYQYIEILVEYHPYFSLITYIF